MNKILDDYLCNKYPKIFVERSLTPFESAMGRGITCGSGWFAILNQLCYTIQRRIDYRLDLITKGHTFDNEKDPIPQVIFKQIKEKFGNLVIYYEGGDDRIKAFVDYTTILSGSICENCGMMGHEVGQTSEWIQHLCVDCAKEYNKNIVCDKELTDLWDAVIKSRKHPTRDWELNDWV